MEAWGLVVILVSLHFNQSEGGARNGLLNPCARLLVGLAHPKVSFFLSSSFFFLSCGRVLAPPQGKFALEPLWEGGGGGGPGLGSEWAQGGLGGLAVGLQWTCDGLGGLLVSFW